MAGRGHGAGDGVVGRLLLTGLATLLPLPSPPWLLSPAQAVPPRRHPAGSPQVGSEMGTVGLGQAKQLKLRASGQEGPRPQPGKKQVLLGALTPARHVSRVTAHQGPYPIKDGP